MGATPRRGPPTGSGDAALHGRAPKPTLGPRPDLRGDVAGAYQDRPGNKDVQLSILYNAKRDLDVFDDWQEYFRKHQPPTLITWGKNDGIFTVEGAELFKRDIPSAELHLLDTGHFALEEEVDRIGSLMHEFLDRTINKKYVLAFNSGPPCSAP